MKRSKISQNVDGEFWFSLRYAAELLETTAKKIETMAVRELIRSRDDLGGLWVAETDVNRLRHDPASLALVKVQTRLPRVRKPVEVGGLHERGPDQNVLGISDHRFPLSRKIPFVGD